MLDPVPIPRWVVNFVGSVLVILIGGVITTIIIVVLVMMGVVVGQGRLHRDMNKIRQEVKTLQDQEPSDANNIQR